MEWLSPGSSKEGMLGWKDTYTVRNQAFKNHMRECGWKTFEL